MVGARKLLDRVFDKNELNILDDILHEFLIIFSRFGKRITRHQRREENKYYKLQLSAKIISFICTNMIFVIPVCSVTHCNYLTLFQTLQCCSHGQR